MEKFVTTYSFRPPTATTEQSPVPMTPVHTATSEELAAIWLRGGPVYTHGVDGLVLSTGHSKLGESDEFDALLNAAVKRR